MSYTRQKGRSGQVDDDHVAAGQDRRQCEEAWQLLKRSLFKTVVFAAPADHGPSHSAVQGGSCCGAEGHGS